MKQTQDIELLISRWEDQRDIKNLMGRYVLDTLLEKRGEIFEHFWSKSKEDVCLGMNTGWYIGRESVTNYYSAMAERTGAESALLKELLPNQMNQIPEEKLYGTGHLDNRPASSPVIAVAEDGETAKAMFTSMGYSTQFSPVNGPVSHWIWGVYVLDLVYEDDGWRIWHMQYLEELNTPCGQNWIAPKPEKLPSCPEFGSLAQYALPDPDLSVTLYEAWSPSRTAIQLPPLPVPYKTFADTFSYGVN